MRKKSTSMYQKLLIAVVSLLLFVSHTGFAQLGCGLSLLGAGTAPACTNTNYGMGAGQYVNVSLTNGVYYTFSYANNAQSNGMCINGTQITTNPYTVLWTGGTGTFQLGVYRNTTTWSASSASLTYKIETPPAPTQTLGNIGVGPVAGSAGSLADANLSASGCWNGGTPNTACSAGGVGGHEAYRGRVFRSVYQDAGVIGWAVDVNGSGDYWQADLGSVMPVNGVASQGREDAAQWLGSYTVQTSIDGSTWFSVPGTFSANGDQNTVVTNWFGQYHARYVRIYTTGTYTGHQSARFDVLTIPEGSSGAAQTVYASAQFMPNTGEIRWYTAASGGTYLGSGRSIGYGITQNTTIYAASYNGGCESARTPVLLRINDVYGAGAAGVGNTNGKSDLTCWLDANKISQNVGTSVATWSDMSGNGRNATQATAANQPSLQNGSTMNNQRVVNFSTATAADQLNTANYQAQYGGYTVYTASRLTGGANSRLITSSARNWLMGYWGGLNNVSYNEGWNSAAACNTGGITPNTSPYLHQVNSTGPNTYFYSNGATVLAGGSSCGIQSFGGFALGGGCCPGPSEQSNGEIGEVIAYDRALNEARRLIVQNYLAAKYNIGIANDLYVGDGIGDCDFDVSGIGRETSGYHLAGWSGGLYMSSTVADYLKDNGDYIIYGRNNATAGWETSNLATCGTPNPSRRLSRIWYIDKTDGGAAGGNVSLAFDLNEMQGSAPLTSTNYHLLYRAGNSGNFASIGTGTVSGNRVQFTLNATAITDGQYTLGYDADIPRALTFNGSNYVEVPNSTSLYMAGDFSYEMWVRPTSAFTANNTYFENGLWGGQTIIFRQDAPGVLTVYVNGTSWGSIAYTPPLNTWTHLAVVRSGSNISLFVNGVAAGTFLSYGLSISPASVMRIGSSVHTTGQCFTGQIDEFRFWTKALTATEITNRMHSNIDNSQTDWGNLQAYYKFDESGGTKVFDLSQNNNNGTPVSSPTVATLFPITITDITGSNSMCQSIASAYAVTTTNTLSRVTYNWVATGGTINSGQGTSSVNVTWNSSGTQNIAVTITHSTNCRTETYNENVTVVATPSVNVGGAMAAICQGGTSAALGGSFGGGATGVIWSSSAGGTFSPNNTDPNATYSPPGAFSGTATLTLTTTGMSPCSAAVATKNIVVNPNPASFTVNQLTTTPLCIRGTSQIQVPSSVSGLSYQLRDNTTNVGGSQVGNGSALTFMTNPLTLTNANYNVLATNAFTCTTATSVGSIPVDVIPTGLANNNDVRTCYVNTNNYVEFRSSNGIMVAINSNGQNLGNVVVTEYDNGTPLSLQACNTYQPWYRTATLARHWVITPQFQPTLPVSIRTYFDNSNYTALSTAANTNANPNDDMAALGSLDLSKYSNAVTPGTVNGSFTDNCNSGGVSTVYTPAAFGNINALADLLSFSGTGRYTEYSFTGFSEFWLSGSNNVSPLPIELTTFSATCEEGMVRLDWMTATEINNEKFIVDRSIDLQTWEDVATVAGAGNSNAPLSYSIVDERPTNGLSYYRLTQRDYDGQSETFEPVSITCYSDGNGNTMIVYPNPASGRYTVSIFTNEAVYNANIQISDLNGKRISLQNMNLVEGNNEFVYDSEGIQPGTYIIHISSDKFELKPIKLIITK